MKILLTGADGQLGRAMYQILWDKENVTLVNTVRIIENLEQPQERKQRKLDITDASEVMNLIMDIRPDVIINCAAFTKVDLCEMEKEKAQSINELGVKNVAVAAQAAGAKLVQVSTDYVFDGSGSRPYNEEDEPNPVSVYGKTKLAGERAALQYCEKTFIVRTAWLYGDGKNFLKTMLRLAKTNQEVRVVNDQYGTPTTALELAKLIWYLIQTERYGVYHATCEGMASWYEFAVEIFKRYHLNRKVIPISTEEYKAPARRPMYSVLENKKLNTETDYRMKDWKEALDDYVSEGKEEA